MRRLASKLVAGAFGAGCALALAGQALAEDLVGQPTPGAIDLQPGVTPLRADAQWFHNTILLPMCVGISLLVLVLLLIVVIKFNRKANPIPARWSHNTKIEVIWTLLPVLILAVIAIFSFRLLVRYHDMPTPDLTLKATGNQWNWAYEFPDQKIPEYVSVMLPEDQAKAKGVPYRLGVDNPVYVPVNKVVRVLVTGADVIHAFGVPAFGIIIDAIPGRVNETWFKATREGVYYGQCRELCGVDHAFMPIEIHVVSQAEFDAWTISKGGMTKAQIAAKEAADHAAAAQAAATAAAAAASAPPAAPAGAPAGAAGAPSAAAAGTPAAASAPATTTTTAAAAGKPASTPAAPPAGQ